jgi:SAM-dependent methyltransferase
VSPLSISAFAQLKERPLSNPYDATYYDELSVGSSRSAAVVVPFIHEILKPDSVLDVGCGIGWWLQVWMQCGVSDVIGVDGPYVSNAQLLIPAPSFMAADLAAPLELGRRFDLVSCLEVGEHLDPADAATLVGSLTRHGDVVLFAAATPGQAGTHHVNGAWPSYWAGLFADRGFEPMDGLRNALWNDERITWWYRQNMLLFVSQRARSAVDAAISSSSMPLDVAHPGLVHELSRPQGVRAQSRVWLREALWSARQKLSR